MWTPIGSRFSIEQMTTTLSFTSRITSSSNSSQPTSDSSTSTWRTGLSASARSSRCSSSSGVRAMPPPCPPSVNAGRRISGKLSASGSSSGDGDHDRLGDAQPDAPHRLAEEPAVLGPADGLVARPDQLDAELLEDALLGQAARQVERRAAAERRQERVGPLPLEDAADAFDVERLEVGAVGVARVGHDRRRVRVDDDRPEPLGAQHLQRLASRVVELAGLPDHDRAGADHADRG